MNRILPLALLLFASCSTVPTAAPQKPFQFGQEEKSPHHVNLYLGQRSLDESDFRPSEDEQLLGIEYAYEAPDSAIGWELGFQTSSEDETGSIGLGGNVKRDVTYNEFYAGLLKSFQSEGSRLRPYIGGGASFVSVERDDSPGASLDESSGALYLHGGVTVDITDWLYAGLDVRLLTGTDIEMGNTDVDADYEQVAFILGFSL